LKVSLINPRGNIKSKAMYEHAPTLSDRMRRLTNGLTERGGEIDGPGEQPEQMEQPENGARNGVVVARMAHVQKPE